ncbi:MAG: peptidylprolyl isomerase [Gammaproteobacteria bacterium]|nr:MAG: peptidylprolyl isomerase [Gammaproteobacteria bacterium]
MLKHLLSLVSALLLLGSTLPVVAQAAPVTMLDRVLVVVDDDIITLGEFESALKGMQDKLAATGEKIPSEKIFKEKVLEQLVYTKLLQLHAENTGINVTDEMLKQAMERLAKQNNLTVPQILQKLKEDGVSEETFKEDLKRQLLVQRVIERDVKRGVSVQESEIDGILKNVVKDQPDRLYNLSHIMLPLNEEAAPADLEKGRERGKSLRRRILDGKIGFEAAARKYSGAADSEDGGGLDWKTRDQLPALFADALEGMQEGDISEPLVSPSGIHLLKLNQLKGSKQLLVNQTRARHILFKAKNKVDIEHAKSEMLKIRQRILAGEDFGELATELSQDSGSAIKGGELGWLNKGDTVPAFEQAMDALQVGEISQPIVSQFGAHLIQLEERRMLDVSEQKRRDAIRQQIGKRKVAEKYDQFLKQLKSGAFIEYRVPIDEM